MASTEPPIFKIGYVTSTTAQLIWSMTVTPLNSVSALYWRDGHLQNSILLDFSPLVIQNLVPSTTYNIYLSCGIERSTTLQFHTRDVFMLCGPIDDGGDDNLVPLSSMSIRYVLLHNQVEYFVEFLCIRYIFTYFISYIYNCTTFIMIRCLNC